jgi:hypothetical protein
MQVFGSLSTSFIIFIYYVYNQVWEVDTGPLKIRPQLVF